MLIIHSVRLKCFIHSILILEVNFHCSPINLFVICVKPSFVFNDIYICILYCILLTFTEMFCYFLLVCIYLFAARCPVQAAVPFPCFLTQCSQSCQKEKENLI